MIRFISALFLALLLCGCAREENVTSVIATEPTLSPAASGFYDSRSDAEVQTQGVVLAYPLELPDVYGFQVLGNDLIVLSLDGTTRLTVLTGDTLIPASSIRLPFVLSEENLRVSGENLIFYDPTLGEIHILDCSLNTVSTVKTPDDLIGIPVLSDDRNTLYYCTADALRAWDLESGIRRCVKDMRYEIQSVTGLHRNDTILECTIQDGGAVQTLFLSVENGSLLHVHNGAIDLQTQGESFFAAFPCGPVQALSFGSKEAFALTPRDLLSQTTFLPQQNAAVSAYTPSDGRLRLDFYRLEDGSRQSSVEWNTSFMPKTVKAAQTHIFLLGFDEGYDRDVLYRWEPDIHTLSDNTCYTGPYYSRENSDLEGLARCQIYANVIGQQHGIQVKIGKAAVSVQPWDYDLEEEYLVPVLEESLHLLEQWLSHYPGRILSDTASHFSSLTICLVRSITGSAESGSLDSANGIQFFDGKDAYVVITPGEQAQQAFYHEMFHAMETHLMICSTALDRWEELNPTGFRYDYSYITNKDRDSGIYLSRDSRSFVDTYSMSFPKEDKARIMEYAMLPGQDALFQSPIMQAKLRCLSQGLREAYELEDQEETFLWEQYLD